MKRLGAILGAALLVVVMAQVVVRATVSSGFRFEVYQVAPGATPTTDDFIPSQWVRVPCDGTGVVTSGVVRVRGFETSALLRTSQVNMEYHDGTNRPWYVRFKQTTGSGEIDNPVFDIVQDNNVGSTTATWTMSDAALGGGAGAKLCTYTEGTFPSPDEGFVSDRVVPTNLVTGLRVDVHKYSDGSTIPCGSTNDASKYIVRNYAVAPVTGLYNFHAHIETTWGNGPSQMGDTRVRRAWEVDVYDVKMAAGVETMVVHTGPVVSGGTKPTVVHFAQQTLPGAAKNEAFCMVNP